MVKLTCPALSTQGSYKWDSECDPKVAEPKPISRLRIFQHIPVLKFDLAVNLTVCKNHSLTLLII